MKKVYGGVRGCFRETGELAIELPALRRPKLSEVEAILRQHYRHETELKFELEKDISPEYPITLVLGTFIREGGMRIAPAEYERCLLESQNIFLGFQHSQWFSEHAAKFRTLWLPPGKLRVIHFPGFVVRTECKEGNHEYSFRNIPLLYSEGRGKGRIIESWEPLGLFSFSNTRRVALART